MKKLVCILSSILICSYLFNNCRKEGRTCPTCSENITWDTYGDCKLQDEGWDGNLSGRDVNTNLVSDCKWKIYGNNTGGVGKVYAVYSCDTAVTFVWTWGSLTLFQLSKGWTGSTKEGIRMGDDITKFLSVYPYFETLPSYGSNSTILQYKEGKRLVEAVFSPEKKLIHLYVRKD